MIRPSESVCACVCGRWRAKIQKFPRKLARISTEKLRNFGAERAQRERQRCAEAVHMSCRSGDTFLSIFYNFFRRWARVARKICADFIETSAISTKKSEVFCGKMRGKEHRRARQTLRMLCSVHEEMIWRSESCLLYTSDAADE